MSSFQGLGIIHTAKKQMVDKITNRKLDEKKMEMERRNMGKLWNPAEADRQEVSLRAPPAGLPYRAGSGWQIVARVLHWRIRKGGVGHCGGMLPKTLI